MELRQLEYFMAVAEEANFTRAAERVHISQSGVSAQVRALENELGAELFDRSGRSATLTTAGKAALPHARAALSAAENLTEAVDEVNGLVRGRLTAGMIKGCEVAPWFAALAGFHREHPGIDIELREDNSDVMIAEIRAGSSDIALVGIAGEPPPGLAAEVIISEGLAAIVDAGHPLAARKASNRAPRDDEGSRQARDGHERDGEARDGEARDGEARDGETRDDAPGRPTVRPNMGVPLAELITYPLVALPKGTGIRSVLDQACARAKLTPRIALEASAPTAVADLGARGLGVAVLSQSMADGLAGANDDMVAVPITGIDVPALLAIVWRAQRSPAVAAFVAHCRKAFAG
jgi:DNA-binding transcriptional LysR family regulator